VAESCVFYKPSRVNLTFAGSSIPTAGPRDVLGARLKFPGYVSREAEFFLYSVHFKAGTPDPSTGDSTTRRLECTDLRNNINAHNLAVVTRHFLIGGDTNFYGTWEGGYARLRPTTTGRGSIRSIFPAPGTTPRTRSTKHNRRAARVARRGGPSGASTIASICS